MTDTADKKNAVAEKEIDLIDLARKLWENKRFIIKVSLIGFVVAIIIAFSIPKEYSTTVVLAPEAKSQSAGNMGALAAMAGINLNQPTDDAISPDLYPNIVNSTPFMAGLFGIHVKDEGRGIDTSLYSYLDEDQSKSWWSYILGIPSKISGLFSSKKAENPIQDTLDGKRISLSHDQSQIIENLKGRINVSVDKKTGVITLTSTMQSPEISAFVADTVTSYLQGYIIKYRTQKARQDLDFTEKLYEEAKSDYFKAQQDYTTYIDRNQDIVSARYGSARERLQNEVTLTYGVYNQMAQQLQMAKVKVQDTTPVYTVIQPAVVPLNAAKPQKKLIVIGFVFLAFLGACFWVLGKEFFEDSSKSK